MIDSSRFLPLLAATGVLVLLHQLSDLAMLLPGIDFAMPAGRVRLVLALESRSPAALTADFLLITALIAGRFHGALRSVGVLHLIVGALLVVALPVFLIDAGRVANSFGGSEAVAFRVVVARTLAMLPLLGIGAILAGRALRSVAREVGSAELTVPGAPQANP